MTETKNTLVMRTLCCGAETEDGELVEIGCFACDPELRPTYVETIAGIEVEMCKYHAEPLVSIENEDADPECPRCYFEGVKVIG